MKRILTLVVCLLISGCAFNPFVKKIPFVPTLSVPATSYYGAQHVFNRSKPAYYMKETEIFSISSEQELALLLMVQSETGITKLNFISEVPISLNKTFIYLESIYFYPFTLSSGYTEYTKSGKTVDKVQFIEIIPLVGHQDEVKTEVINILATYTNASMDNTRKIQTLHDYVVGKVRYDTSITSLNLEESKGHSSFEAYGALLAKTAVCSGYSKAMIALSVPLNIPILYISSKIMQHAWNLVYNGSEWLYLDATWDDPIPDKSDRVMTTYFMKTKTGFLKDGLHHFDVSSDTTLTAEEYLDFAYYVFPSTKD